MAETEWQQMETSDRPHKLPSHPQEATNRYDNSVFEQERYADRKEVGCGVVGTSQMKSRHKLLIKSIFRLAAFLRIEQ
jgi:hypothetical protein